MKKVLLTMIAAMTISGAMAQEKATKDNGCCKGKCEQCDKKDHKRPDRTEMMTKELNLTPEQAAKVKALNEKYPELNGPHRGGHKHGKHDGAGPRKDNDQKVDGTTGATAQQPKERPSREEMEKKMQERKQQQEAYDKELKKILTKDQYSTYEKNKPQPGQHKHGHGKHHK